MLREEIRYLLTYAIHEANSFCCRSPGVDFRGGRAGAAACLSLLRHTCELEWLRPRWLAHLNLWVFQEPLVLTLVPKAKLLIKRHQLTTFHRRRRHTVEQTPLRFQCPGLFEEVHMTLLKQVFPRTLNLRFRVHVVERNIQVDNKLSLQIKLLDQLAGMLVTLMTGTERETKITILIL